MRLQLKDGLEVEVTEPTREMFPATLGGAVEFTISHWVFSLIQLMGSGLGVFIGSALVWFLDTIEPELIEYARPVIDEVLKNPELPGWLGSLLRKIRAGEHEVDGVFSGELVRGTMSPSLTSALDPLLTAIGYGAWSVRPIREPDIDTLVALMFRGIYSPTDAKIRAAMQGFREDLVDGFAEVARPRMGSYDLIRWMFRELVEDAEVGAELGKRGYTSSEVEKMTEFARPLTSPDDLQDMMFRKIIGEGAFLDRLRQHGYTSVQAAELADYAWHLLAPGDIVELWKREGWSNGAAMERLREHGFKGEAAKEILKVARPLSSPGELVQLLWRFGGGEFDYEERLSQHGYTPEQIAEYKALAQRIPGPPDLISMAVREAFHPELVAKYHYMDNFPEEFAEWMEKQGFSRDWAEKWWVAHWRLPSIRHAFEMLHRGEIEIANVQDLLIAADIAPVWHTPIINTAYQPLTRVDVRRMFRLGVLDRKQVYESYERLGYSPENAEYMTQFTEMYALSDDRDATKADILKGYRMGVIGEDEARGELTGLGYPEEWVGYYLQMEIMKQAQELLDDEVALLKDQYIEGQIGRTEVYEALGLWNLPDRQIRLYLDRWDITKERKISIPTTSQLENFLKAETITEAEYTELMQQKHYTAMAAGWFLQEIRAQIAEDAKKEEERARKEAERVEVAIVKTDYDVSKADIDLDIAELKLAHAENLVLLATLTDPDQIKAIWEQNEQIQMSIIVLRTRKAEEKLAYTKSLRGFIEE